MFFCLSGFCTIIFYFQSHRALLFNCCNGFLLWPCVWNSLRACTRGRLRQVWEFPVKEPVSTGHHHFCFCKDNSGRFEKDLTFWVLPFLGCLLSSPEGELSVSLPLVLYSFSWAYIFLGCFIGSSWNGWMLTLWRSGPMLMR